MSRTPSLTPRQLAFLGKLQELYHEHRAPVHYTAVAERLGLADWLMVRGVNLLYPHAFYYSIRDYRVHERPPDLGMHNAWWPHYRLFADYTSRLCGLLTDSRQVCDVAVLSVNNRLPWRAARRRGASYGSR